MAAGMVPSASRPEYMNATPHHSKLRVNIGLSSPLFVAGEEVTGKMEMECRADNGVGIGLIMVELFAVQELNSRDHSATSTFLHIRRLFQGPGLPPSNAVVVHPAPGQQPLPQGHFPARRGATTFFFRFPIPLSSPSAVSFASGLARVRYEVRASVSVAHRGEKRVVTDTADVDVVQCADMDGAVSEHVVVGENGKVYVQGRVLGGRLVSGQQACVELHVKNHSPKKTTGLSLTLRRALHLQDTAAPLPPIQLTDTLVSQNFRGAEYTVQSGAEGVATLVFDVPSAARVVKGGPREGAADGALTSPLFELRCILAIRIGMGIASNDVLFEIPVQLSHPSALPSQPDTSVTPPHALSPPNPYFAHSPGPDSGGSSPARPSPHAFGSPALVSSPPPQPYASPPLSYAPPGPYYLPPGPYPHQHLWSPPPPNIPYFAPAPDLQHQYYFPPPPGPLIPFAHPARPNSAGAPPPLPSGLPGVGVAESSGLPGVAAVAHAYPTAQSQHHNHAAREEPPSPQSQPHPDEQSDKAAAIAEEGKGARASRIAQHLRTSTRARSASPTAHRFPGSAPALPEAVQTMHHVPHKTPHAMYATAPRNPASPPVLSPRPVRSPRNSLPAMAGAGTGGTARSGRVDLLERMVDPALGDEGRSVAEVLRDLEHNLEKDKTLPPPPIPSGKVRAESVVPRARDVFAAHPGEINQAAAALPKKSVLRPSPMARRISAEETVTQRAVGPFKLAASGLDALERRLVLEVGTRKPERPERPTILPLSATSEPTPRAPASSSAVSHAAPPQVAKRDSEISELALASHNSAEHDARTTSNSPGIPTPTSPRKEMQELHAVGVEVTRGRVRDKDKGLPRMREEKTRQQEALKLRKEAKGRVADWLGAVSVTSENASAAVRSPTKISDARSAESNNVSVEGVKASADTRIGSPLRTTLFSVPKDSPPKTERPQSPKGPVVSAAQDRKSPRRTDKHTALDVKQLPPKSEASPRSQRLVSPPLALPKPPALKAPAIVSPRPRPTQETSPKDKAQHPTVDVTSNSDRPVPRLPKFLSSPVETKYDVRSARGGRGGIATSVATMWASLANERNKDNPIKPIPRPVGVAPAKRPAFLDVGKSKPSSTLAENLAAKPPAPASGTNGPASSSAQTQQPRNMIKSASVPAAVVSSYAKPHLSSSASLARSALEVSKSKPPSLSPTLSGTREVLGAPRTAPVARGELAFGQARIKDLIKKYQQGAS